MPCELNIVGFKQHTWNLVCINKLVFAEIWLWFCWWVVWHYNNNVQCLKAFWKQHNGTQIHTEFLFTSVYCSVFPQYERLVLKIFYYSLIVLNWNTTLNIYLKEAADLHWCSFFFFFHFPGHVSFSLTVCNCLTWTDSFPLSSSCYLF